MGRGVAIITKELKMNPPRERAMEREKCEGTFHRYYSLDPCGVENTGEILVISICSNCGDVREYRTHVGVGGQSGSSSK